MCFNVNPYGDQDDLDQEESLDKLKRPVSPITRAQAKKLQDEAKITCYK